MATTDGPWTTPPADLRLPPDEVHVWRLPLDQPRSVAERLEPTLSPDERARVGRFRAASDAGRFLVGRGWLRSVLGRYLAIEPGRLEFRYGPRGKPALEAPVGEEPLDFNLAHSGGLALLAVAHGRRIGIDLEQVRPMADADRIVSRYFAPGECARYRSLTEDRRLDAFFRCWTRKEAYMKAIGVGLSLPLDGFEVSLAPGEPPRLIGVAGQPSEALRWSLCDLDPGPGFAAAVAAEGAGWRLIQFHDPRSQHHVHTR